MTKRFIELEPEYRGKPLIVNGVRYVRCRACAGLYTVKEMLVYGGQGMNVNIGLCCVCGSTK